MNDSDIETLQSELEKTRTELKERSKKYVQLHNKLKQVTASFEGRLESRTQDLVLARDKAIEASRAKSEFLSSMSHELRTPLNAIIGFTELLLTDQSDPLTEIQQDSAQEIKKAGNHLLELINEVLDIARIESGKIELNLEPVELWPLLEDAINVTTPMAQQHDIKVDVTNKIQSETIIIQADQLRLKQVLINLLSNAIKYNQPEGRVLVRTELLDNDVIRIFVEDTGIGIMQSDLDKIFESFVRVGKKVADVEGTGVGLSLTKRIIESMEGSIGVDSKTGRGSSFWIDIPLSLESRISIETPRTSTGIFGVIDNFNKKILYIEDDQASSNLVTGVIEQKVFLDLITAATGQDGIDSALQQSPDLIIVDIGLPDMSGMDVLKTLRSNSATAHLPIIALSARASEKDIQEGLSAGFDSYLTKPVLPKHLLKAISVAFYRG